MPGFGIKDSLSRTTEVTTLWGLGQPPTSCEEISIDDQVNLRVGEFFSSRYEYCYFHLIVGEAAGV